MQSLHEKQAIAALFETETSGDSTTKMTKRDWIAAMCLQGILANKNTTKTTMWSTAQSAVMYADQLIVALDANFETGVPLGQGATLPATPPPIRRPMIHAPTNGSVS